jgi:quercetin dioxygenase-like cupin family protein
MAESDAVRADPKHYTVELEDDRVRVLRTRYEAGEKSVPHSHPSHLAIFLTDAHIRFNDRGGGPPEAQAKAGQVVQVPATTHQPENVGGQPIEAILVELKDQS